MATQKRLTALYGDKDQTDCITQGLSMGHASCSAIVVSESYAKTGVYR